MQWKSGNEFLTESRRLLLEDYLPKIGASIERLSLTTSKSGGEKAKNRTASFNLLLHLAGNLRQWIGCGIGERVKIPRPELLANLRATIEVAACRQRNEIC